MSIELKQAAQDAAEAIDWLLKNIRLDAPQLSGKAMGNAEKCASALRAAIQRAEAKQPATPEPIGTDPRRADFVRVARTFAHAYGLHDGAADYLPRTNEAAQSFEPHGWVIAAMMQAYADGKFNATPVATPESVQADSSEHLRVVASLGAALRRLSFAAQTTGGTGGPDAELQSAIGQAEQALSLGGIWQAMSATGEPVAWPLRAQVWKRESTQEWVLEIAGTLGDTDMNIRHTQPLSVAYENVPGLPTFYTHPAPGVPGALKDRQISALVNKVRDIARMFHGHQSLRERIAIELVPALKASQDVQSNAERWIYAIADGGNQSMNFIDIFGDWDGDGDFVEVFDAARLADK